MTGGRINRFGQHHSYVCRLRPDCLRQRDDRQVGILFLKPGLSIPVQAVRGHGLAIIAGNSMVVKREIFHIGAPTENDSLNIYYYNILLINIIVQNKYFRNMLIHTGTHLSGQLSFNG